VLKVLQSEPKFMSFQSVRNSGKARQASGTKFTLHSLMENLNQNTYLTAAKIYTGIYIIFVNTRLGIAVRNQNYMLKEVRSRYKSKYTC
jgi:hypothetical protein